MQPRFFFLTVLCGGTLMTAAPPPLLAATSATLDALPGSGAPQAEDTVDVGGLQPIVRPNPEKETKLRPGGNPLWAVPLSVLTATQERPIFSATRRPPQRSAVAPVAPVLAPAPQAAEPERPPMALIGAVVGEGEAIAVFQDAASQKIVRLRQGESYAGWVLNPVGRREVTLSKADQTVVLVLQRPGGPAGDAGVPAAAGQGLPTASSVDASFAPFTPHATPKNGEADGL